MPLVDVIRRIQTALFRVSALCPGPSPLATIGRGDSGEIPSIDPSMLQGVSPAFLSSYAAPASAAAGPGTRLFLETPFSYSASPSALPQPPFP